MIKRFTTSFPPALAVTLSLLLLMQALIATGRPAATDGIVHRIVDFVRVERNSEPVVEREPPERIADPLVPPERTPADPTGTTGPRVTLTEPAQPEFEPHGQIGFALVDGEALALTRVQPIYPAAALRQGLEGHVIVSFTVLRTGAVGDPVVVESSHRVFERAALEAAAKFRYKPRVVDGQSVETYDVRTLLTFKLDDGGR